MKKFFITISLIAFLTSAFLACNGNKDKGGSGVFTSEESTDTTDDESDGGQQHVKYNPAHVASVNDIDEHEAPDNGLSIHEGEKLEQPAEITSEVVFFKNQFIVSYNMRTKCPNYVAWHLTKDMTNGSAKRQDTFTGDELIGEPSRVECSDYAGSGYDRGHMCPAADNKNDDIALQQSFMMTNVCPQNHELNEGEWNDLEMLCRKLVRKSSDVYIVCGPVFDSRTPKKIGIRKNLKISVPDRFFKVILMLGKEPKAIGFIFPNKAADKPMKDYSVSVDKVEKVTGFDFFPNLKDNVENKVEAECNPEKWGL